MKKILSMIGCTDIKATSIDKLITYLKFCRNNNTGNRIKGVTALHHILPKSIFPQYSNLKIHDWNGVHLSYYDHYYAHWLLTEATDVYSFYYAFYAMHNKDVKNGRLLESELISKIQYNLIMENKKRLHKERLYSIRKDKNGVITTGAEQLSIKNKANRNKIVILEDGSESTVAKENGKEHSIYLNKEIILEDGSKSSICIESGKKHSIYLNKEIILEDGSKSTRAKERGKKLSLVHRKKGRHYKLYSIFTGLINKYIDNVDLIKISAVLPTKTKENYLGKHFQSKKSLNAAHNLHLVGLYVEEIT